MSELSFVPKSEFDRVRKLEIDDTQRAALFATMARINTLYMIKKAGSGHIGSSFSAMDIVCWLYLEELGAPNMARQEMQHLFFSSKGHDAPGVYSVLTALGLLEFDLIHKLRKLGGLPGHPDVKTPFVTTNTGSLGMGVSKAKGMALAHRLQGDHQRIFVMTGDGELQEGQFWESLLQAAQRKLTEITVLVDHNKIQSDTYVAKTSDLGDLKARFESHGWKVLRCNGHDFQALKSALDIAKAATDAPYAIICDTIKGRGVSFMQHTSMEKEQVLYRYHSGAPSDTDYIKGRDELIATANTKLAAYGAAPLQLGTVLHAAPTPPAAPQRLVKAYGEALRDYALSDQRVVALDADLVLDTGLIPFRDAMPDRFFECGIAEQDMVSMAGGMALRGLLPVVHSFACFLSTRPNEQFYNNATELTKVMYVGSLAGLIPGPPGHSHQCVRDISSLGAIPAMALYEPCTEAEVGKAVKYFLGEYRSSVYLRLVTVPYEVPFSLPNDYRPIEGRGAVVRNGRSLAMIGYGPVLLAEAYKASEMLQKDGIDVKLIALPWLNRLDLDWLNRELTGISHVITLDNHYVAGGQGEFIASQMAQHGMMNGRSVRCLGVTRIPSCGSNEEVLRAHGLDAFGIAESTNSVLHHRRTA